MSGHDLQLEAVKCGCAWTNVDRVDILKEIDTEPKRETQII